MPGTPAVLMAALFVAQGDAIAPHCTPAGFQGWFRASAQGALQVPRPVEARARQFRYVFVAGFANERIPGYFGHCAQVLRLHGVPAESIHGLYPSSRRSIEGNRESVRAGFAAVAAKGPERLVVIAHSRGASDALAFALENPAFVRDRVEAIFLVQGAFGGSGLADYVMGKGEAMDRQMPLGLRMVAQVAGRVEMALLRRGEHRGISSMTRKECDDYWDRMRQVHADAIPIVRSRTYFIASQVHPSRLRLLPKAMASYLHTYYGPNDGVVLLSDQTLPGLGTPLGVFNAGHADLTHHTAGTRASRPLRKALVESIVMAVGTTRDDSVRLTSSPAPALAQPPAVASGPARPRRSMPATRVR